MAARHARGEVVVDDGPDPDRPLQNVRRLRRADPVMAALGWPDGERERAALRPLYAAAEELRDAAETVQRAGAPGSCLRPIPTRAEPWDRGIFSILTARARERVTAAFAHVGEERSAMHVFVLRDIVLCWTGLRAFEDAHRIRHGSAAGLVREALACLADRDSKGRR